MGGITADRLKSGRLALRYLADAGVRKMLRNASVPEDAPIAICEWETPVGEVMQMIGKARMTCDSTPDHVLVVIRRGEAMQSLAATSERIELIGDYISSNEVHRQSSIGHVYEALLPRKEWHIGDGMQGRGIVREASVYKIGDTSFELV